MVKWIKKNSRYILIAFAILIMIVFILPQQMLQPSGASQKVFELNGRKVTLAEYRDAGGAVKVARQAFGSDAAMLLEVDTGGKARVDAGERMVLLTEEARRGGFIGAPGDASTMLEQNARDQIRREMDEMLRSGRLRPPTNGPDGKPLDQAGAIQWYSQQLAEAEAAHQASVKAAENQYVSDAREKTGSEAFSEFVGIIRMLNQDAQSLKPSLPRLLASAKRDLDSATIQYTFVPVDETAAKARPAPSDADLQSFYDKYKDTRVGTGEFGIGYRQPNRIALQWLTIDRELIAKGIKADQIEVQKELMKGATVSSDDSARRATIEADLIRKGTDNAVNLAKETAKRLILQSVSKLPDEGSYKGVPADFKPVDLAKVAQGVVDELRAKGIEINLLPVRTSDSLMTLDDLRKHPDLGFIALVRGSVITYLCQFDPRTGIPPIFNEVREFKPASPRVFIQQGIPLAEPLTNMKRDAVYICVTQARPEASPANLAEVREQVIADKKKFDEFESLKNLAPGYAVSAAELGMTQLVDSLKQKGNATVELKQGAKVSRRAGLSPADTNAAGKDIVDAIMERAGKLDPTVPFDQSNALLRTVSVPVPSKMGVIIAQITAYEPLTKERFRELADQELANAAREDATRVSKDSGFSQANLIKRLKVDGIKPAKKDGSATPDPAGEQ